VDAFGGIDSSQGDRGHLRHAEGQAIRSEIRAGDDAIRAIYLARNVQTSKNSETTNEPDQTICDRGQID
jgi:hypothetical protein